MKKIRLTVAVLAAAALVAACGDDDNSKNNDSGYGGGAATEKAAGAKATNKVGMKDIKFVPADITVKAGDTVTWTNEESVPHDVKAEKGADFASETFGEGKTFSYKTTAAGTIDYVCTLHPGMEGTITVTK